MKELPYIFDLAYDCKTEGDVRREIKRRIEEIESIDKKKDELRELINYCREHGLNKLAKEYSKWG